MVSNSTLEPVRISASRRARSPSLDSRAVCPTFDGYGKRARSYSFAVAVAKLASRNRARSPSLDSRAVWSSLDLLTRKRSSSFAGCTREVDHEQSSSIRESITSVTRIISISVILSPFLSSAALFNASRSVSKHVLAYALDELNSRWLNEAVTSTSYESEDKDETVAPGRDSECSSCAKVKIERWKGKEQRRRSISCPWSLSLTNTHAIGASCF
jgi:hypothetical protein